jgi:hypothetical protein
MATIGERSGSLNRDISQAMWPCSRIPPDAVPRAPVTFRKSATEIVERLTGQKMLAFLSDHAVDPDYAIEAFVLESEPGDEAG